MAGRAMAPPKKKGVVQPAAQQAPISGEERIRIRAHEIYRQRHGAGAEGSEVDDWLQAEAEIRAEEVQA